MGIFVTLLCYSNENSPVSFVAFILLVYIYNVITVAILELIIYTAFNLRLIKNISVILDV
jgi:hypothetical protein